MNTVVNNETTTKKKRKLPWVKALLAIVFGCGLWVYFFFNPFPTDEELIEHFHTYQVELERLVELFQTSSRASRADDRHGQYRAEWRALTRRADVERVVNARGSTLWLPNPYTIESARQAAALIVSDQANKAMDRYSALTIELNGGRYFLQTFRYGWMSKRFLYFPQPPKVDEGLLWWPFDTDGKPQRKERVFPTLTRLPPGMKKGECVFRRIEAQWFISLCRAW